MTLIRKKALEISSWVTWLASPGCKDWAEGLEREVAFIPSDWRALGWAIGSVRVLFTPRAVPLRSLAEVPAAAAMFVRDHRLKVSFTFQLCIALGAWHTIALCFDRGLTLSRLELIGHCLIVAAAFSFALQLRSYSRSAQILPSEPRSCALFYRSELLRYVSLQSGLGATLCLAALVGGLALTFLSPEGSALFNGKEIAITLAIFVIPLPQARASSQKFRHQVSELEALLAEEVEPTNQ
jgi:hypothetical protein